MALLLVMGCKGACELMSGWYESAKLSTKLCAMLREVCKQDSISCPDVHGMVEHRSPSLPKRQHRLFFCYVYFGDEPGLLVYVDKILVRIVFS